MNIDELKLELLEPDLKKFDKALDGFDISEQDKFGNNILHYYLKHVKDLPFSSKDMIDLLIAHGIDINQQQQTGKFKYSSLHLAVVSNLRESFDALIEYNANVNLQDENGNTPLFIAVFNYLKDKENYSHYITTLLAKGADANIRNKSGISPKELAGNIANSDVKKFFSA